MADSTNFYKSFDGRIKTSSEEGFKPTRFLNDLIESFIGVGKELDDKINQWIEFESPADEIKKDIFNETGMDISIGEAEYLADIVSKEIDKIIRESDIGARTSTVRKMPFKTSLLKDFKKIAHNKYKMKYSNISWQVKAIPDEDGTERFYLVRLEPDEVKI
jgi:nucleotidyltransferase/DNA polymerase involved in DNA repair